jgi:flagellar biosynthetic protein FliQ
MTQEMAIYITSKTITTALTIAAPMLIAGLLIGLMISIFQAVTQINEMTLTFIPKILMTIVALLIFLPWMTTTIMDFIDFLITLMPMMAAH